MTDEQRKGGTGTTAPGPTNAQAKPASQNGQTSQNGGTKPAVTARRPLSKAEYAKTTQQSSDATAVIPAIKDDQPAPDATPTESPATPKPAAKKTPAKKAPAKQPAAKKAPAQKPADEPTPAKNAFATPSGTAVTQAAKAAPAAAPPGTSTEKPAEKTATLTAQKTAEKPAEKAPEQKAEKKTEQPAASVTAPGRSARLKVTHVEPWSVTKMAFVVSVALMIVSVVAITVFWVVLQITGVWGAINDTVSGVLSDSSSSFDITEQLGFGRVVGLTLLASSLNVIFMTALATIAAHLYNLASGLLGGIELTFGERK